MVRLEDKPIAGSGDELHHSGPALADIEIPRSVGGVGVVGGVSCAQLLSHLCN